MVKIAVVDDESEILKSYESFFARFFGESNEEYVVSVFSDGLDLVNNFKSYDVIFLDIDMKTLNGLQTAEALRKMDENVILIFVTRLAQYAINGYKYNAFDFILKPVDYFTLKMKMLQVMKVLSRRQYRKINVTYNGKSKVLSSNEILFIEVIGHKLIYHTLDGETEAYGTISDVMKDLSDCNFIVCHRCYLVNAAYIVEIKNSSVVIKNGEELPMSRLRKRQLSEYMASYFGKNI